MTDPTQAAREAAERIVTHLTEDEQREAIIELALAFRQAALEEAATIALEQRCERGTPWDLSCTMIAEKIRRLASPAPKEAGNG